ncbi:MerR family transcriptional regulator [Actinomadura yumaensis]|uniref:MerR family transcriptional regulator n=1 Tax=Actinomadura TaxID=1988 RepID=UPI00132B53D3|nr:MerR family transcriptional regulator [Actinomadura sp. J1-007]MWK35704.1 MerR family transcriptional regulator [Actinomadura sp. J1-007]
MDGTWTITELAERAAEALAADGSVRHNGRVRDLPNERLIRWYTTIGLVDPPLGRRGRTALYGHRHLLQLLAVKRRQSAGRTIAQIQAELAGATDATLEHIAATPPARPKQRRPRHRPARRHRQPCWGARRGRPEPRRRASVSGRDAPMSPTRRPPRSSVSTTPAPRSCRVCG